MIVSIYVYVCIYKMCVYIYIYIYSIYPSLFMYIYIYNIICTAHTHTPSSKVTNNVANSISRI